MICDKISSWNIEKIMKNFMEWLGWEMLRKKIDIEDGNMWKELQNWKYDKEKTKLQILTNMRSNVQNFPNTENINYCGLMIRLDWRNICMESIWHKWNDSYKLYSEFIYELIKRKELGHWLLSSRKWEKPSIKAMGSWVIIIIFNYACKGIYSL